MVCWADALRADELDEEERGEDTEQKMQDLILTCTERWEGAAVGQEWPSLFCGTGLGRNGYSTVKMPLQQKIYNYETECTGQKGMIDVDRKSVDTISPSSIFATRNTLCSKCTKIFPSPGGQFCILLRSDHRSTFTHILRNSTVSSFIEFQSYAVYAARAGSSVTDTRKFNIEAARLCLANFDQ